MREIKLKSWIYIILLYLLILFHCVNNFIWAQDNNSIVGVDSQNHLLFQLQFSDCLLDIIKDDSLNIWEKLVAFKDLFRNPVGGVLSWPQFVYLSSYFFLLFERSLLTIRLSMLVYFFILILSVFRITKQITNNGASGLLAAVIVSFYPMIFESSRQFQLDFPLTAITALAIFLLLCCDGFKRRGWAMLCGLIIGIGMHIKGQLLFFIMPVLIVVIIKSLFIAKDIVRRKLLNLSIFMLRNFKV